MVRRKGRRDDVGDGVHIRWHFGKGDDNEDEHHGALQLYLLGHGPLDALGGAELAVDVLGALEALPGDLHLAGLDRAPGSCVLGAFLLFLFFFLPILKSSSPERPGKTRQQRDTPSHFPTSPCGASNTGALHNALAFMTKIM